MAKISDSFDNELAPLTDLPENIEQDGVVYTTSEIPGHSSEIPGHSSEIPGHSSEIPGHSSETNYNFRLNKISEINRLKRQLHFSKLMAITSIIPLIILWYLYGLPNSRLVELDLKNLYFRLILLTGSIPILCFFLKSSVSKWVRLTKSMKELK